MGSIITMKEVRSMYDNILDGLKMKQLNRGKLIYMEFI